MTSPNSERDRIAGRLADEADGGLSDEQIGEARTSPGRPPLPEGGTRCEQVVVRVTPADKARLVWLSDFTGEQQSDLARRALDDLFRKHGIKEAEDPDDHPMIPTGRRGESVHFFRELVGSKVFAEAVAQQVRRELERHEQQPA